MYICERCGYSTTIKCNMKSHLSRKKMCPEIYSNKDVLSLEDTEIHKKVYNVNPNVKNVNPNVNPNVNIVTYKCRFCSKTFKYRQSRYRHELKYCLKDMDTITIKEHNKKIGELKKQVEDLLIKNTTINNNKTLNVQQNITINSYGKENLDYLTNNYLTGLIYKPFDSVQCLLKTIHFNPKHPENHNIKISNKKQKYANVYNSGNWEFKKKKDVIENIVDNGYNIIDCYYDEVKDKLEAIRKDRFSNFQLNYDNDPRIKKTIESDVEMIILNGVDSKKLMST